MKPIAGAFSMGIGLIFQVTPLQSQTETPSTQTVRLSCADLQSQAIIQIPQLDESGEAAHALEMLENWASNCPQKHLITYTRVILQMRKDGRISSDQPIILMDHLLDAPVDMQSEASGSKYQFDYSVNTVKFNDEERRLLQYLFRRATELGTKYESGSLEYFVCMILSGERDAAIRSLRKRPISESVYAKRFEQRRRNLFTFGAAHVQLRGGVWNGLGNASSAGQLTSLGLSMGGCFRNGDIMDLTFDGWLGGAPARPISIAFLDTVTTTDFVSGVFTSLDYDKALWRHRNHRHRLGLRLGAGYSHLNLVPERYRTNQNTNNNNNNNNVTIRYRKYVGSFTASLALNYSYSLNPWVYINGQARYFLHDFNNAGGTDIRGGSWCATIGFGFFFVSDVREESRRLGLKH